MSNKSNGTKFEKELCEMFAKEGMWARLEYPDNDGSQPFDLKVIYRNNIFCFECKDCQNGKFPLDRVEENQKIALNKLQDNLFDFQIYFAFKNKDEIIFLEANDVLYLVDFSEKRTLDFNKYNGYYLTFNELVEYIKKRGEW